MVLEYNRKLKQASRDLRNNMTEAEKKLWYRLKSKQINNLIFYRQKIIGNFIADFYCHQLKIVIEIDGGQHYTKEGLEKDNIRDKYLASLGIKTIRFTNIEVLNNIEGVILKILNHNF